MANIHLGSNSSRIEALKAEGYANGTQNNVEVGSDSPYYQNNAKYYNTQAGSAASTAGGSETAASGYASAASTSALKSEGYAIGKQNGVDVTSGSDYYENNAKYYNTQAGSSASAASGSATSASTNALISEGYAVGKQNGTDVTSGSTYYENNAKYYSDQASASATTASGLVSPLTSRMADIEAEQVIQDARMDSFTTLAEGSTTGDAELIDGRTGADGVTYANIGGAIRGQVSDLKSEINEGLSTTLKGYWAESWTSQVGGNIYKSDSIIIPKGCKLEKVRINSYFTGASVSGYIFIVDENNKILDKISQTFTSTGWNVVTVNKTYDADAYIAVSALGTNNTYSNSEQSVEYSLGLYEATSTETAKGIGDTITFAHNVATRHYSFGVDATYKTAGLSVRVSALESQISTTEGSVDLDDFTMPKVYDTGETGYTLLGRWYSFSTFSECCNSAGAGVMFKVKGATSVSVEFEQVVHPSHPDWRMSVEPYIAYSVDGSAFTRAQIGSGAISISIDSTDEHLVWIVVDGMCLNSGSANRNSGWSAVYLKSLTTDGNMYKVEPASKQILFVGDSIVEGINTLGTTSTSDVNSAVAEFSFKTARKLNSIPMLQGYGGSTSLNGIKYERYSWVDASINSFIVNNKVDAILIEYGYNDSNAGYTTAQFKEYYNELIDMLVGHYSGVPVFCLIPFKQSFAQAIREIASARSYCYCIETSGYTVTYSDNAHPDASGATSIAESLSEDIIKIMGKGYFV